MDYIIGTARLFIFFIITILLIPVQALMLLLSADKAGFIIPDIWHKTVCALFGIRVHVHGKPYDGGNIIFVSNHISYLDIPVISSVIPVRFIAKKEVAQWPLFGILAKLQRSYFIDRSRMAAAKEQQRLAETLQRGGRFVMFPEGTSSDGSQVLPFKSASFSMLYAQTDNVPPLIQPVSIVIHTINGEKPLRQDQRDIYAWYGDMELAPHLWILSKQRSVEISLYFHEIVDISAADDRKILAAQCESLVARAYKTENYKVAAQDSIY